MYDEPKFMTIDGEVVDTGIIYWNVDTANNCRDIFNTCCSKLLFASNELANITIPEDCLIDVGILTTIKTSIDETAKSLISTKNALLRKVERLENADKTNGEYVNILDIYDQKREEFINDIFNKYFYEGQNLEDIAYDQLQYAGLLPYLEIPLFNQKDSEWAKKGASISEDGCGLVAYSMVLTYLLDIYVGAEELAEKYYGEYFFGGKAGGTNPKLFIDTSQSLYGINLEIYEWPEAWGEGKLMEALRNGQPIIAQVGQGVFTGSRHYVVIEGLTEYVNENGEVEERVIIKDPNGDNYKKYILQDGFENGFPLEKLKNGVYGSAVYFVFDSKETVRENKQAAKDVEESDDID